MTEKRPEELIHPDWEAAAPGFTAKAAQLLEQAESLDPDFLPGPQNVFRAFWLAPQHHTCILLGQDPYPTPGHAMGLAFSADASVSPLPRSLANIFTELKTEYPAEAQRITSASADLSGWQRGGVLLANTSLTVSAGRAGSHSGIGWQGLVQDAAAAVIRMRASAGEPTVTLEWGRHAQKAMDAVVQSLSQEITAGKLPENTGQMVLRLASAHPSPLSASRGFFGSAPFEKANAFLQEHGAEPVPWAAGLDSHVSPSFRASHSGER